MTPLNLYIEYKKRVGETISLEILDLNYPIN